MLVKDSRLLLESLGFVGVIGQDGITSTVQLVLTSMDMRTIVTRAATSVAVVLLDSFEEKIV
jgi:hypothetical protein